MKRSDIIYQYKSCYKERPRVSSHSKVIARIFQSFAIGGLLGLLVLFSPLLFVEARYRLVRALQPEPERIVIAPPEEIKSPSFAKLVNEKYMKKLNPVDPSFSIVIPKIGLNSKVIANVNAADKGVYTEALKKGAAHAAGTRLPGKGTTYIFAHSTDYIWNIANFNAIFFLLKELEQGDQVHLVYNGELYPYRVSEKRIVNADDTYYLKPNDKNQVILQTCWPLGTTSERMLVIAELEGAPSGSNPLSYNW